MNTRQTRALGLVTVAVAGFAMGYFIKDLLLDLLLGGSMF